MLLSHPQRYQCFNNKRDPTLKEIINVYRLQHIIHNNVFILLKTNIINAKGDVIK